jgi:hypothetical protein
MSGPSQSLAALDALFMIGQRGLNARDAALRVFGMVIAHELGLKDAQISAQVANFSEEFL